MRSCQGSGYGVWSPYLETKRSLPSEQVFARLTRHLCINYVLGNMNVSSALYLFVVKHEYDDEDDYKNICEVNSMHISDFRAP